MTILNDRKIIELILQEKLVDPYELGLVNGASLDIRIGNNVKILEDIEEKTDSFIWTDIDITKNTEAHPYYFNPSDRILVNSLEYFRLPNNISAEFKLKSSIGRQFIQQMMACWCDPGWHGTLTMELINWGYTRVGLYPGKPIGQLIFFLMENEADFPYRGKYHKQVEATPAK